MERKLEEVHPRKIITRGMDVNYIFERKDGQLELQESEYVYIEEKGLVFDGDSGVPHIADIIQFFKSYEEQETGYQLQSVVYLPERIFTIQGGFLEDFQQLVFQERMFDLKKYDVDLLLGIYRYQDTCYCFAFTRTPRDGLKLYTFTTEEKIYIDQYTCTELQL